MKIKQTIMPIITAVYLALAPADVTAKEEKPKKLEWQDLDASDPQIDKLLAKLEHEVRAYRLKKSFIKGRVVVEKEIVCDATIYPTSNKVMDLVCGVEETPQRIVQYRDIQSVGTELLDGGIDRITTIQYNKNKDILSLKKLWLDVGPDKTTETRNLYDHQNRLIATQSFRNGIPGETVMWTYNEHGFIIKREQDYGGDGILMMFVNTSVDMMALCNS